MYITPVGTVLHSPPDLKTSLKGVIDLLCVHRGNNVNVGAGGLLAGSPISPFCFCKDQGPTFNFLVWYFSQHLRKWSFTNKMLCERYMIYSEYILHIIPS